MSADSWEICPRCRDRASIYGSEAERTFREDYEWWVSDGTLHWAYAGACTVCDLSATEKGSKQFYVPVAEQTVDFKNQQTRANV